MPVRPIDPDDPDTLEVVEDNRSSSDNAKKQSGRSQRGRKQDVSSQKQRRIGPKVAFLLCILLLGGYFSALWNNLAESDARYREIDLVASLAEISATPGLETTTTPKPTRRYRFFASEKEREAVYLSPEETWQELQKESGVLVQETVSSASAAALDVGAQVLGEATTIAEKTASDSADKITATVYKYTIGAVIKQLMQQLPDTAKDDVLEDICESEGCVSTGSAELR